MSSTSSTPSRLNCTPTTPRSSEAVARTSIVPATVPASGSSRLTVGFCKSGGATVPQPPSGPFSTSFTNFATDGTPWSLSRKSMYQPGGAALGPVGAVTLTQPVRWTTGSLSMRWFMSTPCVTAAGATRAALVMFVFGVSTPKLPLNPIVAGADAISGRAPRNR